MSRPNAVRRAAHVEAAASRADTTPRCGVCDQPSASPVCRKCADVLTVERFGDPATLRQEAHR